MTRITKNSFGKGINTDLAPSVLPPEFYTEAFGLSLIEDGEFLSLKNVQGTSFVGNITGNINTLTEANIKSVVGKWMIHDVEVNACAHFITGKETGDTGAFFITVYDLDNDVLYYIYRQQNLPTDYFDEHRIVDFRAFAESNKEHYYFTDGYNELRQLTAEIPTGAPDYFLSDYDLSLQRRGANGTITLVDVGGATGTLLSGTYQYAYRCVDPDTKRFTKWSSLSDPLHIYAQNNSNSPVYSAVGISTPFAITINIAPTAEELAQFSYYQLAVVENVYPLATAAQPAALLPITPISGTSDTFTHSNNQRIGLVPIEDIVVDLAAIKHAKTLAAKQYRLHAGNIEYWNLEPDNGTPAITGGNIATATDPVYVDGYSNHNFSSTSRGYFRDETYRFGVVYRDRFGNKGPVNVLDLSSLTDNQITTGGDVHFPGRDFSNDYTLFNSNGRLQGLGLSLVGLHNHPTWSVGFEIVRAKRIKRVLFQTPMIPVVGVQGVGAIDDYPSRSVTVANEAPTVVSTDAQPQTSSTIYVPKNLFWPEARVVRRRSTNNSAGAGIDFAEDGEAELTATDIAGTGVSDGSTPIYGLIFPPSSVYGDVAYEFKGFEKYRTIDFAAAKLNVVDFNTGVTAGDSMKTQISGTFYSASDGDYYFDSAWVGKSIVSDPSNGQIKDYNFFTTAGQPAVIGGNRVFDYTALNGTGINWGYPPTTQKSAVIQLANAWTDPMALGATFASAGVLHPYTPTYGSFIFGASGPSYQLASVTDNKYVRWYGGFSSNTTYVQAFRIINVVNDFGDDRYGPTTTNHEFISTGASYAFTESELAQVQAGAALNIDIDVFGGDCFVAPHIFKVADTAYSVVNQRKNNTVPVGDSSATLLTKWDGKYYLNQGGEAAVCLPVAVQGAGQFIEVILESEYNGGVMNQDITVAATNVGGVPIMNIGSTSNSVGAIRSPLLYTYNVNISKQNDQKIYAIKQPFSFAQYVFKARDNYSDIKIYGSDIQGFDIFRVGNTFDLEENKGALTKLAISGDYLYAVQESGVVYLPTSQSQVETTDGGALAVGVDQVIGRPIIIDQQSGGQHLNAIVETGTAIYIPDVANRAIYRLIGTQPLEKINTKNFYTTVREQFGEPIPENQLIGLYNQINKEFWLVDNKSNTVNIFSENIGESGLWQGGYEFFDPADFNSMRCIGGMTGNQQFYLLSDFVAGGRHDGRLWTMYTGANDVMFNITKTPRVTIAINPDSGISKTFDDMMFNSTERLASLDLVVEREASLSNQVVNNIDLNNISIEGNYRVKTLRDSSRARLRGTRMLATIKWLGGNENRATLTEVFTKYRWSARSPF